MKTTVPQFRVKLARGLDKYTVVARASYDKPLAATQPVTILSTAMRVAAQLNKAKRV